MKLTYKICLHFLIVEQVDLLACYGLRCVQKHCPILLEDTDKVSQDESHVSLPSQSASVKATYSRKSTNLCAPGEFQKKLKDKKLKN